MSIKASVSYIRSLHAHFEVEDINNEGSPYSIHEYIDVLNQSLSHDRYRSRDIEDESQFHWLNVET